VTFLADEGEQVVGGTGPEDLARLERSLERGAAQVREQDVEIVRVEPRFFRAALEQELGVVDDVLVDRRARRDEDADARLAPPARPAELLPGRGDGAGVAGEDRDVEGTDVDARISPSRNPRSIDRRSVGR